MFTETISQHCPLCEQAGREIEKQKILNEIARVSRVGVASAGMVLLEENNRLKAELKKWKAFYEALPYCMDLYKNGATINTHKDDIARSVGLEV